MAINLALIAVVFLTRNMWEPWYLERRLTGRNLSPGGPYMSPDGRRIATAESDFLVGVPESRILIHDLKTGEVVATLRSDKTDLCWPSFSQDGTKIATACRYWAHNHADSMPEREVAAMVWDVASGSCIKVIRPEDLVPQLSHGLPRECSINPAWSPDGKRILVTLIYGEGFPGRGVAMAVLDADTGRILRQRRPGHTYYRSTFSPDGGRLLVLSYSATGWLNCELWDAATLRTLLTIDSRRGPHEAAWSPDGKVIVAAEYPGRLGAFDAESGRRLWAIGGHTDTVHSIVFSPDGARLATASRDKAAAVWDARTGELVARLEGHTSSVRQALFSPDGSRVFTSSHDGTVRIWDAGLGRPLGRLLRIYEEEWVFSGDSMPAPGICLSADGRRLAVGVNEIWRRRRPEWWWGIFVMPLFWLIAALGAVLAWSVRLDVKTLREAASTCVRQGL